MSYVYKNPNPNKNLVGDCVIRGISILINKPWEYVYTNIVTQGFKMFDMPSSGMTAIQAQLCNGFSNNAAASADIKYTIATEACASRATSTANTQSILDKLCQLELDNYKRENDQLRSQLNMAALRESQTAQNALIQQGFSDEVDALYNRLSNCPVPSTPVYGRTPIFTCGGGCGCNGVVA